MKIRSRQSRIICLSAAVSAVMFGASNFARANSLTWDNNDVTAPLGQDGDGTWDTTNFNWVNGDLTTGTNVQWNNATPDSAVLGSSTGAATGGTSYTLDLAVPIVAQDITFQNSADAKFYNIADFSLGTLTLNGNISKTLASGNPQILLLSNPLTLSTGTHTITTNDTSGDAAPELSVNAKITGAGGVTIDNQSFTTFGSTGFLASGNDYAGNTNINNGRLEIKFSDGLGATSAGTTIGSLGTLQIGGNGIAASSLTIAEPITITRNTYAGGEFARYGAAVITNNGSGTTTFSGPFVVNSTDARISANTSTLLISSNITTGPDVTTGTLSVTGDFAGFVTLTGDNSALATGGITLLGGVELNVSSQNNLGGASSPLTFAGNATLHPVGGFMTTFGTHVINQTTFSGGFDVDSGQTFTVDIPLGDSVNAVGQIGKRGLGTLNLNSTINLRGSQTFWDAGIVNVNGAVTLASLHLRSPVVNIGTGGSVTTTAGFDSFGADSTGTNGGPDIAVVNLTGNGQLIETTGDDFNISDNANTQGTINISDTAVLTTGGITFLGKSAGAIGTINQSGGTVTINRTGNFGLVLGDGRFANTTGPTGNYTMTGGTLTCKGEMYVGEGHTATAHATGSFTMSGGIVNLSNWFVVGREGGVGTVALSGTSVFNHTGGNTSIGDSAGGTDQMTMSDSAQYLSTAGEFWVGTGGGSVGTLIMKDNTVLTVNNWFPVGRAGALGTLDMSGHASITKTGSNNSYIGESTNAVTSTMSVRENSSFFATTGEFWVGQGGGIGILNIQDSGQFTVNNWLALGRANGASQGTINLSGGTLTKLGGGFLAVGSGGTGTLNQTGGTLSSNGTRLAEASSGTMNLSAGTATFTGEFSLGYVASGVGTMNISGTANVTVPAVILGVNSTTATNGGILNLNGGTLTGVNFTAGAAATGLRKIVFNGGLLKPSADNTNFIGAKVLSVVSTGGALINPNAHTITDNSALTHDPLLGGADGGLTVSGTGTLILATNASTYTGNTAVNGGTLSINTGNVSPNYTVASGATLNVNGTIPAAANVTTAGTANFAGNTTITTTTRTLGTLAISAGGTAAIAPSTFPFTPAILRPATLTFANTTSKFDVGNNELIATGTAASAQALIQAGQLISTQPADPTRAVGYISLGGADTGKFEARYTLKGDTDLSGNVDVGDLGSLATAYGITGGQSWANGDFNLDNTVDVGDLGALATNYGTQLAAGPSFDGGSLSAAAPLALVASAGAAVPEPTTFGLIAVGSIAMLGRRRRRTDGC